MEKTRFVLDLLQRYSLRLFLGAVLLLALGAAAYGFYKRLCTSGFTTNSVTR